MLRIQRKRIKGWKKPEGCISVSRPSKYGNPYKIVGDMIYGDASHRRGKILSQWIFIECCDPENVNKRLAELFEQWILGLSDHDIKPCPFTIDDIKRDLKDHKIMCFCSLEKDCHGDVLLKYLNC